jgi:hypothetical protein
MALKFKPVFLGSLARLGRRVEGKRCGRSSMTPLDLMHFHDVCVLLS